jgi:hypothetical protein
LLTIPIAPPIQFNNNQVEIRPERYYPFRF